jgi:hypothetical protein
MIPVTVTVAANSTNNNVVSGSAFEFARTRQLISVGFVAAAAGVFAAISAGSDLITEEFELPILTTYPIIPDNMYFTDYMENGDRLVLRARNSTGAGIIVRAMVQISPV